MLTFHQFNHLKTICEPNKAQNANDESPLQNRIIYFFIKLLFGFI